MGYGGYYQTLKLIRARQILPGDREITLAYVLLIIRGSKVSDEDRLTVDIIPLIKKDLIDTEQYETSGEALEEDFEPADTETGSNRFSVKVDTTEAIAKIYSGKRMMLTNQLRGHGIGSFAFSEIIKWLKARYPNIYVEPIPYDFKNFMSDKEREALHSFYENFGFKFEFERTDNSRGSFYAKTPGELKSHFNPNKIEEIDLIKFISSTLTNKFLIEDKLKQLEKKHSTEELVMNIFSKDAAISVLLYVVAGLLLFIAIVLLT